MSIPHKKSGMVAVLLLLATAVSADSSNIAKTIAVLEGFTTKNTEPLVRYIDENVYIQHNPNSGDGRENLVGLFGKLPEETEVNVIRAFEDGDYVFTHSDSNFFGPKVHFDIFRFSDGKIVEHWDNIAVTEKPNASGRTQVDGETELTDLDLTEQNKFLVRRYIQEALIPMDFDLIPSFFNGNAYIQHNPTIGDGLDTMIEAFKALPSQGINLKYHELRIILGQGNFVLAVSDGELGEDRVAFYDLFRVEDGKIAEHWDVIAGIPAEGEARNRNGKF